MKTKARSNEGAPFFVHLCEHGVAGSGVRSENEHYSSS
jgi:hypothetical protein